MRRILSFLSALLLCIAVAFSQEGKFEAVLSSGTVDQNAIVSVSFKYSGDREAGNFQAPDFAPFRTMSSPAVARSSTIVNGVVSNEYRYTFTLAAPNEPGRYIIPSAGITAGGQKLLSEPVEIKVERIDPAKYREIEEDVFIEVKLSKDTAYIGEPVKLEANLYFRKHPIENGSVVGQLNYEDFISESLIPGRFGNDQKIINGNVYQVKSLGARILYPRKTGSLSLGTLVIQAHQVLKSESIGFFRTNTEVRPVQLKSEEVKLYVIDIPRPAPEDFIGAIGTMEADFKISKAELSVGESFTIWTILSGSSDINRIGFPEYKIDRHIETYAPRVVKEDTDLNENRIVSHKVFEQICIAGKEGRYSFNLGFSYFDTELKEYVRLSEDFNVEVRSGNGSSDPSILAGPDEDNIEIGNWVSIGGLVLLMLTAFVWYRKRQKTELDKINIVSERIKSSDERLSSAVRFFHQNKEKEFYEEIYRLWNEFVLQNCRLPQAGLNRRTMKSALINKAVPAALIEKLEEVLNICDLSLYGKIDKSHEMAGVVENCEALLKELDDHFKRNSG